MSLISFNIRLLSGEQTNVELDSNTTIAQLQERLFSTGFLSRAGVYRYIFSGRQLALEQSVGASGIAKGNVLHVVPTSPIAPAAVPVAVPAVPAAVAVAVASAPPALAPTQELLQHNAVVLLQSVASGKNLRIRKTGSIDANGRMGVWARFVVIEVAPQNGGAQKIMLQNVGTNKFIRVTPEGLGFAEKSDANCVLSVVPAGKGFSLRGEKCAVGVLADGKPKTPNRVGQGKHAQFIALPAPTKSDKPAQPFKAVTKGMRFAAIAARAQNPLGQAVAFKVFFQNEIRRFELALPAQGALSALSMRIGSLFNADPYSLVFKYEDNEQDVVSMYTDEELKHALALIKPGTPLRVHVSYKAK